MTDLPALIKSAIPMPEAARFYGYEPNFAGFIKCPFHTDKTASMKIYPGERGFCCFGCHTAGSVIDFVMKLFNIPFRDAIARLNEDFQLGLTNAKPDPEVLARRRRERQEADKRRAVYEAEYRRMTDEYRRLYRAYRDKAPRPSDSEWDDEFCEALRRLPEMDEWFERNEYQRG